MLSCRILWHCMWREDRPLHVVSMPEQWHLLHRWCALHLQLQPRLHGADMCPARWLLCPQPVCSWHLPQRGNQLQVPLWSRLVLHVDSKAFPRRLMSLSLSLTEGHPQSVTYTGVASCCLVHTYSSDLLLVELSTGLCFYHSTHSHSLWEN